MNTTTPALWASAETGVGTVTVLDASGDPCEVTPGVLDEEALWVYTHGQCLALAVAVAVETGWPVFLRTFTDGDGVEDGQPVRYPNLRHAGVLAPNGLVVDVAGAHDPQAWDSYPEDLPDRVVPAQMAGALLDEFAGFLVTQDVVVATSMVGAVLAAVAGDVGEFVSG